MSLGILVRSFKKSLLIEDAMFDPDDQQDGSRPGDAWRWDDCRDPEVRWRPTSRRWNWGHRSPHQDGLVEGRRRHDLGRGRRVGQHGEFPDCNPTLNRKCKRLGLSCQINLDSVWPHPLTRFKGHSKNTSHYFGSFLTTTNPSRVIRHIFVYDL